jgi:hypothetical protein
MKQLKKDILREAMGICKESNLYYVFTPKEKREAVIHVYNIIDNSRLVQREELQRSA